MSPNYKTKLGFWAGISLVIGNIIGVGIFTTSGYMAQYVQSPLILLSAWIVGGLYALSGAVVYGVLARTYPFSGGDYVYLNKGLHPLPAYIFGWSAFFVTYSGSIAALAIAAGYYFGDTFAIEELVSIHVTPELVLPITWLKGIAIFFILLFTWINYRNITLSGNFQIILTFGIVAFMVIFSAIGLLGGRASATELFDPGSKQTPALSAYISSLVAVLFSYMGWTTAVYVAEEIEKARDRLPGILLRGVFIVIILYLFMNLVYIMHVPMTEMVNVVNIGSKTALKMWGAPGQRIVSLLILIAVLGSLNSTVLSGPRIYMAMGRDGYFWGKTERLHQHTSTPYIALILQAIWSVLLVLSGSFNELLTFVVFIAILFSFLAGFIALNILRREKPVRVAAAGSSIFYILFCLIIMANTLWYQPWQAVTGICLTFLAIPFYFIEKRLKKGM